MKRGIQGVMICGVLFALSGCAALMPERHEPQGITVETVGSGGTRVETARLSIQGDRLVVSGLLKRMHEVALPGHVDIELHRPEGSRSLKCVMVPGLSSNRKGVMNLRFLAHFEQIPPAGSTVRVRYHAPPFGDEKKS